MDGVFSGHLWLTGASALSSGLHLIYAEGTSPEWGVLSYQVLHQHTVQSSLLSVLRASICLCDPRDNRRSKDCSILTTHEPFHGEVSTCLFLRVSLYVCFLLVLWCLTSESPERLRGASLREQGYSGKDVALRNVFCLDLLWIWERIAGLRCVALFQ